MKKVGKDGTITVKVKYNIYKMLFAVMPCMHILAWMYTNVPLMDAGTGWAGWAMYAYILA